MIRGVRMFSIGQKFDASKDYYKILKISPSATKEEIRKAYFANAKTYHPDHGAGNDIKMKDINEAKTVLMNDRDRADYDAVRRGSQTSQRVNRPTSNQTNAGRANWGNQYYSSDHHQQQSSYSRSSYDQNYHDRAYQQVVEEYLRQKGNHQRPQQGEKVVRFRDKYGNEYYIRTPNRQSGPGSQNYENQDFYQSPRASENINEFFSDFLRQNWKVAQNLRSEYRYQQQNDEARKDYHYQSEAHHNRNEEEERYKKKLDEMNKNMEVVFDKIGKGVEAFKETSKRDGIFSGLKAAFRAFTKK